MLLRDFHNVVWNLFLAVVPVVLAFVAAHGMRGQRRAGEPLTWALWLPLLLVWLVFLPNTCYLLTEWRHYIETLLTNPVYFQAQRGRAGFIDFLIMTGFYLIYSGIGLLTFFLAVWPLDRLARRRLGGWSWLLQGVIFVLCALGVYLGLIFRFNSWDLLHQEKLREILATAMGVQGRPLLIGFLLGFGAILWILYSVFDIWMDGAAWRLRAYRERHHASS